MKAFALFMHKELRLQDSGEDIKDIVRGRTDTVCTKSVPCSPSAKVLQACTL